MGRLAARVGRKSGRIGRDIERMEERRRAASETTARWLSLLQEMEHSGQSGDARYDLYFQAYLKAKQQQKHIELELFNLHQGLID